ncbi:MAG: hypothetical protein ACTHJ3_19750 [Pararhizobium sp.]
MREPFDLAVRDLGYRRLAIDLAHTAASAAAMGLFLLALGLVLRALS